MQLAVWNVRTSISGLCQIAWSFLGLDQASTQHVFQVSVKVLVKQYLNIVLMCKCSVILPVVLYLLLFVGLFYLKRVRVFSEAFTQNIWLPTTWYEEQEIKTNKYISHKRKEDMRLLSFRAASSPQLCCMEKQSHPSGCVLFYWYKA